MRMQELKTKMIGMMVRRLITTNTEKRDKLIPSASPNKTVEGAAGGLLLPLFCLCWLAYGYQCRSIIPK
jgi:CDP-diglyceride synthetase